jgi:hypothetical protein
MDKMEILKLAFSKASTGNEAFELALKIEGFLKGDHPAPKAVTESADATTAPQPKLKEKPSNYRRHWSAKELTRLSLLKKDGRTIWEIAAIMGRSYNAIGSAIDRLDRGEYVTPTLPELPEQGAALRLEEKP